MRRILLLLLALAVAGPIFAQSLFQKEPDYKQFNSAYDGRFTFVRVSFRPIPGFPGPGGGFFGGRDLKWDHDYPTAERNLTKILAELTSLAPKTEESNILGFDDPDLTKYPIAYVSEPGFWQLNEAEAEGIRNYLLKGGFLIFDDFYAGHWYNFQARIREALPEARLVRLDVSHPIFNSFFKIQSLDHFHPYYGVQSEYWGMFEDNDPKKRLMMIINYNNDIGDYWEWSESGFIPISLTNEAYKLGVNYIVYAMSH